MNRRQLAKRYLAFVAGLLVMALGIGMGVQADLGISPISCPPYVLSLGLPRFTIGEYTIMMHAVLIVAQIALLRGRFPRIQLLQIAVAFLFGYFCDFGVWAAAPLRPSAYAGQLALMLASCVVQAAGIALEISAGVLLLAGEGAALAVAEVTRIDFGRVKIGLDILFVAVGAALGLWLFGSLDGIREGTLVSALLVGWIIRRIRPAVERIASEWFSV